MVTRSSKLWALLLACVVGSTASCREVPATQLLVLIDSDLLVPGELNNIHVQMYDPSSQNVYDDRSFRLSANPRPASYALPISFGLVPVDGDASRRVRVIVTADTVGTNRHIERSALVGFVPDRKLLLTMFLERACLGVSETCAPNETCIEGTCRNDQLVSLPDITGLTTVDASGLSEVARLDAPDVVDVPDVPDVVDASTPLDVPDVPDVPDVVDASSPLDVPDVVDASADAGTLPTPQLILPTAGATTNSRLLAFEVHGTDVPAGVSAFIEISPSSEFVAAQTVTLPVTTSAAVGGVTTWRLSSVNADELVASGGPIGSRHTLWWRMKLVLAPATIRSVAWPFRLRANQPMRPITGAPLSRAIGQAGDFDGNGGADLLVVNARSGASHGATIILGRPFSHVAEQFVFVTEPSLDFGRAARLGDINADGLEDFGLATGFPGDRGGSSGVYVVLGTTTSSDRTPELVPSTAGAATTDALRMAPVMDSNRDGIGEFVVGFPATGVLRVYRGYTGAREGRFVELAPTVAGPDPAMSLSTAGDFNGDGRGDFVVGHGSRGDADLYLASDVSGVASFVRVTLGASGLSSTVGFGASVTGGGDINGDGFSDVVVAGDAGLRVYYGGVTGIAASSVFTDPSPCTPGAFSAERRVANLGDINGDGGDEVGLAYVGACMIVLRAPLATSSTAPVLTEQRTLFAPSGETTWASTIAGVGDYDDDGMGDFALAIPHLGDTNSTVKVYFGDASLWADGMSAVAPTVMVVTPGSAGFGYSVAGLVRGTTVRGSIGTPAVRRGRPRA